MNTIVYIKGIEFILLPLYIVIFFAIARFIVKRYYANTVTGTYFYLGLGTKLFGSISFALVSQYFFKEGDTFMYFSGGLDFKHFLLNNFPQNFNFLFLPAEEYGNFYNLNAENVNNFGYMSSGANLFTAKFVSFFSIFSFDGYLLTSLFFGLVAFSGMWRLFSLFSKMYPALVKQCAWCFLFLPSIIYWGGGIMKDTICLGAIGWLFSSFYSFFVHKKRSGFTLFIMLASAYVLFSIKAYIATTICGVLGIWFIVNIIQSINHLILKKLVTFLVVFLMLLLVVVFSDEISNSINNEIVTLISETIQEASKNYDMVNGDGGATLSTMAEVQPNFASIISKVPVAVNNALFRPYIWEARKLNVMMSALENMVLLLFTVIIFIRKGFVSTLKKLFSIQLIFFCFIFSILFAVLIGFTCFNYGSLVRYKLPIMPFYTFMLVLLYYTDKDGKVMV